MTLRPWVVDEAGRYLRAFSIARGTGADCALFRGFKRLAIVQYVHQSHLAAGLQGTEARAADLLLPLLPRDSFAFDELILSRGTLDFRSLMGRTREAQELFVASTPRGIDLLSYFPEEPRSPQAGADGQLMAGYRAAFLSMAACATWLMKKRERAIARAMAAAEPGPWSVDDERAALARAYLQRAYPFAATVADLPAPSLFEPENLAKIAACFRPGPRAPQNLSWVPEAEGLVRDAVEGRAGLLTAGAEAALLARDFDIAAGAGGRLQRVVMNMVLCAAGCPFYVSIGLAQDEELTDVPRLCVAAAEQVIAAFTRYDELLGVSPLSGRKRTWWTANA